MFGISHKTKMPAMEDALPGRARPIQVSDRHFVNGNPMREPFCDGLAYAMFGMGCFWGAEKRFWQLPSVYTTAVGYSGGYTPNPTYEEVCSGMTGHNEVVRVVYDTNKISYLSLLKHFWEGHNPTQGMRQGNDVGTQYRSAVYVYDEDQYKLAVQTRDQYQTLLHQVKVGPVTTEILTAGPFYFAEDYHQQYLAKNPNGYCGLGGTGVCLSVNEQ